MRNYVAALRASRHPVAARIQAAYQLTPGARRIAARLLLTELLLDGSQSGAVATAAMATTWSDLGWLLMRCARELAAEPGASDSQVEELRRSSKAALAVCTELRCQLSRPALGATQRGYRPSGRVIDAVCAEAA